ncbi:MAG: TAT-variant-translocated molybdopterin oxidoreductase, partial [Bryobacteraceae bacterium]
MSSLSDQSPENKMVPALGAPDRHAHEHGAHDHAPHAHEHGAHDHAHHAAAPDASLVQIQPSLNLEAIREKLKDARGPEYWRSFEEIAGTQEFQAFVDDEFPVRTIDWNDPINRRNILKVMGASLALAGASACTVQPKETIVPYVRQPEDFVPGKPLFFATAYTQGGMASGIVVESHLGRPTKIEGNPDHPASLGATDSFAQASILTMYDPDRAQVVTHNGNISSWVNFVSQLSDAYSLHSFKKGGGLRILTEPVVSPTLAAQIKAFLADMPEAKWHQYSPGGHHMAMAGAKLAFGQPLNSYYKFDTADIIVSLDADFLGAGNGCVLYARQYATRRRIDNGNGMNRMYAAEGTPSVTGAMADHRLRMKTAEVEPFAFALAAALGVSGVSGGAAPATAAKFIPAIVKDLQAHKGSCIVVAGDHQPASVHALAHAMNQALGNVGKTVFYTDPVEAEPVDSIESLRDLTAALNAGQVDTMIVIGGNPVYDAPADLNFAGALKKAQTRLRLGLYEDETSAFCQWHAPMAHYLESWSDTRAFDGTITIQQPLIAPIYGGKNAHDLFSALVGNADVSDHDSVKGYWRTQRPGADFEAFWETSLHNGVVAGTAFPVKTPPAAKVPSAPAAAAQGMEIVFRPDPTIGEGLYSNNGWLQELPKPPNKMTWDNAVWIGPATAQQQKLTTGDVVEIQYRGRTIRGPVWVMPGHASESITIHLGYGRARAGRVADGIGFNAYALMVSDSPWSGAGALGSPIALD